MVDMMDAILFIDKVAYTMQRLKTFALQQPVFFAVGVIVLSILTTELPLAKLFAPFMSEHAAHYLSISLQQGLVGLGLLWILARFGWLGLSGFTPPAKWQALWLGWPLVLYTLLNATDFLGGGMTIDTSRPGVIALFTLTNLSTGWVEEIMGRGLVLVPLLLAWGQTRKGLYGAVIVSSALFGLAHLINILLGRRLPVDGMAQIVYSTFFGVIFAACMLRNQTIWPVMLLHAAFDFAGNLGEISIGGVLHEAPKAMEPTSALILGAITLPLFLYGLWILRKVNPTQYIAEHAQ